jgi:hypothetical protein
MVDATLGDRLQIRIDPTWEHYGLWEHPLGDRIEITYFDTEAPIADTSTPNYSDTDVIGRGELYKHWVSTANKEIQIGFQFQVQEEGVRALRREVLYPARFIDKLKHPVYDPGAELSYAPPPVLLRFGNLFLIRALVTQADIQWKAPFEPDNMLPHGAEVQTTFTVVRRVADDLGYARESVESGKWR